jgi:CheY-like chemotaxis protein
MAGLRIPILIAEDNANDADLLKTSLEKHCAESFVQIVRDGEEAIDYLAGKGKYENRNRYPFPEFVLTDIKMPKVSGLEVVAWLKQHRECHIIPVIIWSSSSIDTEVIKAYELGANCYFQKPISAEEWNETVGLIVRFWKTAKKPPIPLERCVEE